MTLRLGSALRSAQQWILFVVSASVLLVGLVFLFTTGPARIVIPIGLGFLALDFLWSRYLLRQAQTDLDEDIDRIQNDIARRKPFG